MNEDGDGRLEAVESLAALGFNVVAAASRGKLPIGAWKKWQTEVVPERLRRESFTGNGAANNLFIITGSVSRLCVLDCDDEAAEHYWRDRLGEILDQTTAVETGNGHHYYFRLPEGAAPRGRSSAGGESGKWDLRAEGGGVVAPPSIHPSGREYRWMDGRGTESLRDAPDGLFDRGSSALGGGEARSLLAHLLAAPPQEGNRNMWLSKVAGHYALHIPHQDAYEVMVRDANSRLGDPLPEDEVAKLVLSIWQAEQAKKGKSVEPVDEEGDGDEWRKLLQDPDADTGWLVSGGTRILIQTRRKVGEGEYEFGLATWMDADMRVVGVVGYDDERVYEVEMRRPGGEVIIAALPAATVASTQKLPVWLANRGVSIGMPDDAWPVRMKESTRLVRYLEAQKAPVLEAVPYLGWHDESRAFITHDGIIRADGCAPFEAVRPRPQMKNWAKYRYGVVGESVARDVLRRVLEFHDETVASVFGSWWAAALLKPQIQQVVSQFPFMALEASSESGKTTGYFNLMLQLSGHYGGQANPTVAALRDALSANRSGIVWVDDLDDLEHHGELLRNVTVGGSLVKKGEDNAAQVTATMRAALVVSGEGLGLHSQKALMDRAVLLNVPSPVGRTNRAGRPQWDDILALNAEYPDLTALAGDIIALALTESKRLDDLKDLRKGSGRFADKNAIIRVGARVLAGMTGENWMVELADDWTFDQEDTGSENALTLQIIPSVLRATGWLTKPEGPDPLRGLPATPAFHDGEFVWFSPVLLEDWLQKKGRNNKVRLETRQALEDQARALGLGGARGVDRKQFKYVGDGGRSSYWRCTPGLTESIIARSQGDNHQIENQGAEDDGSPGRLV